MPTKVGFIGAGVMAQSIVGQIIQKDVIPADSVMVSAPSNRSESFWNNIKVQFTSDNDMVFEKCDVIFLAMKPQFLDSAIKSLQREYNSSKLIISMLAGVSISTLRMKLNKCLNHFRIIRIMPNTPFTIGEGCTVYSKEKLQENSDDPKIFAEGDMFVKKVCSSGGKCYEIEESLINAASAIIGCGPAFVYTIIESLSNAGLKHGLPRELATQLVTQTMVGASKMVECTKKHPAALRDEVCSPGGTTIHGLQALENSGLRAGLMKGIDAAVLRAFELDLGTVNKNTDKEE